MTYKPLICDSCSTEVSSTIDGKCSSCHFPNQKRAVVNQAAFFKRLSDNLDAGKGAVVKAEEMQFLSQFIYEHTGGE